MHEARFVGLVQMLSSLTMAALGKLADPETGKEEEVNLDYAREMIDLLDTVQVKTKGNLTETERRYLDLQLTNLRLTYVDEAKKKKE
jgi:hypothetical protein